MTEVILVALLLLPAASVYFFKSNGPQFFFTVCAGFVLVSLASSDIGNLLHRSNISSISSDSTNLILVFIPALLTLLFARKQSHGQLHFALGAVAALSGGALMVLITAPFFGSALPNNLYDSPVWTNLQRTQAWLITAGALASFLSLWLKGSLKLSKHH